MSAVGTIETAGSGSVEDIPEGLRRARARARWTGKLTTVGSQILLFAVVVVAWQIASDERIINPFFFSSPSKVARFLWHLVQTGSIFHDTWVTLQEAVKGFVYGSIVGVGFGFLLGRSRMLSQIFLPILNLLNTLPRVALAPMFILWFGIGQSSKVYLVFSVVFVILVFNTYAGTQTVDNDIMTATRLLGANRWQVMRKVMVPWCLPWVFAGMRIALAWSIGAAIIGEYIAAQAGLGYEIFYYSGILNETGVLADCVVLLIISASLFAILGLAERYFLRWRPERR